MRQATVNRSTTETNISLTLNLEGGSYDVATGIGFLDHMLELFAAHGRFGLSVTCQGDLEVDGHHTVEDVGIALGSAFRTALGEKRGIVRYGSFLLPMDEALVLVVLDISGRAHLEYGLALSSPTVGGLDTQLVEEFLLGLCRSMGLTLHVRQMAGKNDHHIIEALFKGLGRALGQAVAIDPALGDQIPSTKGLLV